MKVLVEDRYDQTMIETGEPGKLLSSKQMLSTISVTLGVLGTDQTLNERSAR